LNVEEITQLGTSISIRGERWIQGKYA